MPTELKLEAGWLAKDTRAASGRVRDWEGPPKGAPTTHSMTGSRQEQEKHSGVRKETVGVKSTRK